MRSLSGRPPALLVRAEPRPDHALGRRAVPVGRPVARRLAQGQQRAVANTELRQRPVGRIGISADRTERPAIVVG